MLVLRSHAGTLCGADSLPSVHLTCVFVRIPNSASIDLKGAAAPIKRVLDIGADGVIVPNVETAEQVSELVRYVALAPTALGS